MRIMVTGTFLSLYLLSYSLFLSHLSFETLYEFYGWNCSIANLNIEKRFVRPTFAVTPRDVTR